MALMALRAELSTLMNSMYNEGILDQNFQQMQMLQDESNPEFVREVITLFFQDSNRILTELTNILDQTVVDYKKVDAYVHQLRGSSSSIGAQRVSAACGNFRQSYEASNKEGCLRALHMVKQEHYILQNKFNLMMQLEQQIQAQERKRQK